MTELDDGLSKRFEIFTNPDKIIDYSKEHWSFLKYSLLALITGVLLGFNFFQSNFMLQIFSGLLPLYPVLLLAGWAVIAIFLAEYMFIVWLMARIYLKFSDTKREPNEGEDKSKGNLITKENLFCRIKVISYCYLIPFLIYELVAFPLTILFYILQDLYLVVIVKDFGTLLIYVWIIPLTFYSLNDVDESQKYKMDAVVMIALLVAYMIQYFTVFMLTNMVANVLVSLL